MKKKYLNLLLWIEIAVWSLCIVLPFLVFQKNTYLLYDAQIFSFIIGICISQYLYYLFVKLELHIDNPVKKNIKHFYMTICLFLFAILLNIVVIYLAIDRGKYYMIMLQITSVYVFSKYIVLLLLIYRKSEN